VGEDSIEIGDWRLEIGDWRLEIRDWVKAVDLFVVCGVVEWRLRD
jgi:hypothetical protein